MGGMNPSVSAHSRRRFLQVVSGGALAGSLARLPAADPAAGKWIDAHVHVWTPDTKKYPLAPDYTVADMLPPSFTPGELFAHCRPQGVSRIVLIQMSFYQYDNRFMLDIMKEHPGVLSRVGIVDENAPNLSGRLKVLAEGGVRGLRITPGKTPIAEWLGSAGMKALWMAAADHGMAVCPLINPEALPLIRAKCESFPKTKVVIDHFARIGMAGPVEPAQLDLLCGLAEFPTVHVKTSAFYALGAKKAPYTDLGPMIRRLVGAYGAERLMWASDCPYQVQEGHNYADSIALVRDRLDFLTEDQKEWMLRKTAEKVFFQA